MTLNKKMLHATLLGACLSTSPLVQASEELTTPPSEVLNMIVDGTKTAAAAVADASVKTYEFVKPYAGAAWDTTKEVTVIAATKTKDAAIRSKEYISERMGANTEPAPRTPVVIESYSLSQPNTHYQTSAPVYNYAPANTTPANTHYAVATPVAEAVHDTAKAVTEDQPTPPAIEVDEGEIVRGAIDPNATETMPDQVAIHPKQSIAPARVGETFVVEDEFTP